MEYDHPKKGVNFHSGTGQIKEHALSLYFGARKPRIMWWYHVEGQALIPLGPTSETEVKPEANGSYYIKWIPFEPGCSMAFPGSADVLHRQQGSLLS
jgi:hypothetical protein